ncbi:ATP-binding protein [Nocardiopsis sp. CT-R113]|uniref:ATP-binding protein n=1 Tax=Nocardiopsis codii TaxID=3065942 RepID=A0ABU7K0H7_9ACTN|nr:ATP-binding protein [Nocardiopsis sp. CT-R113]MEE2035765.1 ATP-binding protein [Nocardiopsis sp. CT-R113]
MTPAETSLDLPRRIRHTDPCTSGLVCGPGPHHVKAARRWAMQATRTTPSAAHPLLVSLAELHANALKHTASGLEGGRVRIEIQRRPRLFLLRVSDDGPRPGAKVTVPSAPTRSGVEGAEPEPAEGGYGLALVDAMALFWDVSGGVGGPLTVRAAFDRSGRTRRPL